MSFTSFVVVCVIALVGYYIFLALKPEKKSFSYEDNDSDFDGTEIVIDPPIAVTIGMVSFVPTVSEAPNCGNSSNNNTDDDKTAKNRYNQVTTVINCSLSNAEISAFYTKDAVTEGESLFSNIFKQFK